MQYIDSSPVLAMLWYECHRLCDASAQDLLQTFKSFPEEQWCRFCWFPHLLSGCITRTSCRVFFQDFGCGSNMFINFWFFHCESENRHVFLLFFPAPDWHRPGHHPRLLCSCRWLLLAHVSDWMDSGRSVNYLLTEFSQQVEPHLRSPGNKLVLPVATPALPGTEIYSPPVPLRSP